VCGWHASGRLDSGPGVPRKMVGQTKRDIDSGKSWPYFYSRLAHNASTTRYLHVPCKMKNEKKKKNTNSVEPGRRRVTSCVIWKTNRLAGGIASPTVYHNITLTSCPHLLTVWSPSSSHKWLLPFRSNTKVWDILCHRPCLSLSLESRPLQYGANVSHFLVRYAN
jgi:hypothetical protein